MTDIPAAAVHDAWNAFHDALAGGSDTPMAMRAALAAYERAAWCDDMALAPRDGTKVDLFFPAPRGRQINCFYDTSRIFGPGWFWREPTWDRETLLPEDRWRRHCYPNMEPTHWRPLPPAPEVKDGE